MKHILKVRNDFYKKDLQVGDEISDLCGYLKVLDLSYENQFGTFILCKYVEEKREQPIEDRWERRMGVEPSVNNPFEIMGTIHIPGYSNMLGGIGFFLKNHDANETLGFSYQQAWNLIYHEGARNAVASSSHLHNFQTKLIDTIDGLPSLDSYYWQIPAYNSDGSPYAPYTKEALTQLEKGMRNAVKGLVQEYANQTVTDSGFEDLSDIEKVHPEPKIVVLAGAGLSTHSGIPDYRSSAESVWKKKPNVLAVLNQTTFERDPQKFWNAMYELIKETLNPITPFSTHEALLSTIRSLQPNSSHRFLAWLSSEFQKDVTIITQNVDGLDKKAGSKKVIVMHGNIHECVCPKCKQLYPLVDILKKYEVPTCQCGEVLRPNVVFFGDEVLEYPKAIKAVENADLIFVVGTSLQVSPFNQLIHAKTHHAKIVLINSSPLDQPLEYDYALYGDISKICQKLKGLWQSK